MAKELIDSELLKLLQSIDTPTVCNAIEVAQGKRGFHSLLVERWFARRLKVDLWSALLKPLKLQL